MLSEVEARIIKVILLKYLTPFFLNVCYRQVSRLKKE